MRVIYFLANDAVYEMAVAFLNSLRAQTEARLCLIPFDDDYSRLAMHHLEYDFTIYNNTATLSRCDQISHALHGRVLGHYRKLAAWHGSWEEFLYIDVDTIMQANPAFVFEYLKDYSFVFARSGAAAQQWVWHSTIAEAGVLSTRQIEFSANTGFFCSRSGELTLDQAEAKLHEASLLRPHMELLCFEQSFLNYLVVTSGKEYTSLLELASTTEDKQIPLELYAGTPGGVVEGGTIRLKSANPVLFVHWAGSWSGKTARTTPRGDPPRPDEMSYKVLWAHYRNLRA